MQEEVHATSSQSWRNHVETAFIVALSVYWACLVDSVVIIWSMMGSSVSIIIAYILPCACYLKIRQANGWTIRRIAAIAILILAAIFGVLCTIEATKHFHDGQCKYAKK